MMSIIVWLLMLILPQDRVDAFHATAPNDLTSDTARMHLASATVAAIVEDVDPALLLSIAHHESRYKHREVTRERGGKVSCGVMTPEPTHDRRACKSATSSPVHGYLAGARHLRKWADACRAIGRPTTRCALLGYAGGGALRRACDRGPVNIRRGVDACRTPSVFLRRAEMIR